MERKKVYILLIQFTDFGSKVISACTGCNYPHASIGLEEDMNTFYSFVKKGFIVEKVNRYVKPSKSSLKCQLYELEVSKKVYDTIKEIVQKFIAKKRFLSYDNLGVIWSMLHIPYIRNENKFFCSGFVADVLNQSGAVKLKNKSHRYFSKDLIQIDGMKLKYTGNLKSMLSYFVFVNTVSFA